MVHAGRTEQPKLSMIECVSQLMVNSLLYSLLLTLLLAAMAQLVSHSVAVVAKSAPPGPGSQDKA